MKAPKGSEGTRDALPPASPVPERQATDGVDRKSGRPAISWTGLFGHFVLSLRTGLNKPCLMCLLWKGWSKLAVVRNVIITILVGDEKTSAARTTINFDMMADSVMQCHNLATLRAWTQFAPQAMRFFNSGSLGVTLMEGVCP